MVNPARLSRGATSSRSKACENAALAIPPVAVGRALSEVSLGLCMLGRLIWAGRVWLTVTIKTLAQNVRTISVHALTYAPVQTGYGAAWSITGKSARASAAGP